MSVDYTYPPIGEVSVDAALPTTAAQRRQYISILYDHFKVPGVKRGGFKVKHPIYTTPIPKDRLPLDHVQIANDHHFTVEVELVGHAFNGSYLCQILCEEEVIGSFAVLSRGDDTPCAACKVRHKAGGLVRGVIDIPEQVIPSLIVGGPLDSSEATTSDLIALLRNKLSVRIVGPSGIPLAKGIHRGVKTDNADQEPLRFDKKVAPKLRLLSAAVAHERAPNETHGPIRFLNWEVHGECFDESLEWSLLDA
jgi:tyrosinase